MSVPACRACGEPLLRKSKFGPPPRSFCDGRCRHRFNYYGETAEDRERWELLAGLLDELVPDGLTPDCPRQRQREREPVAA